MNLEKKKGEGRTPFSPFLDPLGTYYPIGLLEAVGVEPSMV
jgi:hypothetical protein